VFDLADRISVLVYGQVIATDTPPRIRGNAAVQEAYLGAHVEEADGPSAGPSGHSSPSRAASPAGTGGGTTAHEGQK
jgi:hypothetical protein